MPFSMSGAEMRTIRESLLLSAQALADRLKFLGLLSAGNVRTVQRWEEGARAVPEDIAAAVRALDRSVEDESRNIIDFLRVRMRTVPPLCLWRYASDSDYLADYPKATEPHQHRLYSAALVRVRREADALGMHVRILTLDREFYERWRFGEGHEDDYETRAQWAGMQLSTPTPCNDYSR